MSDPTVRSDTSDTPAVSRHGNLYGHAVDVVKQAIGNLIAVVITAFGAVGVAVLSGTFEPVLMLQVALGVAGIVVVVLFIPLSAAVWKAVRWIAGWVLAVVSWLLSYFGSGQFVEDARERVKLLMSTRDGRASGTTLELSVRTVTILLAAAGVLLAWFDLAPRFG